MKTGVVIQSIFAVTRTQPSSVKQLEGFNTNHCQSRNSCKVNTKKISDDCCTKEPLELQSNKIAS